MGCMPGYGIDIPPLFCYNKTERESNRGEPTMNEKSAREKPQISVSEAIMKPLDDKVNRNTKDSIFCNLFKRPEYFLELYKTLHPEDVDVTCDDVVLVTLGSLMMESRYNDFGILVRDKLLVLVEAQSTFTVNILTRFLMYLADTYNRYLNRMGMNIYGTKKVAMPVPELYVIYPGERKEKAEEIRLSKEIFGINDPRDAFVDVKAKVIYDGKKGDIINQYVVFSRVFDKQVALYGYVRKAVEETLRICKDQHVLSAYLAEEEVADIMFTILDWEKAQALHDKEKETHGAILAEIDVFRTYMHMSNEEIIAQLLKRHPEISREEIEAYVYAQETA